MKVLVTGASGFIGGAFLKHALSKGLNVRVLTRNPNNWHVQPRLEVVTGDLSNQSDWRELLDGIEIVVHAAAESNDPVLMPSVNVHGPERLLYAAVHAGVKRWVQLSSVGSYGPVANGVVRENCDVNPSNPYEISKTDFDEILQKAARNFNIEVCLVRPSNVYGPDMRNQSIKQMLNAIQKRFRIHRSRRHPLTMCMSMMLCRLLIWLIIPRRLIKPYHISGRPWKRW